MLRSPALERLRQKHREFKARLHGFVENPHLNPPQEHIFIFSLSPPFLCFFLSPPPSFLSLLFYF